MNVYLNTLGCRLNEAEILSWDQSFRKTGHHIVKTPDNAHVVVLNTCGVTKEATRKSKQLLRRIHRHNPEAKMVVTGCYTEIEKKELLDDIDLIISNQDKDNLVEIVTQTIDPTSMPQMAVANEDNTATLYRAAKTRAFIKVQDGCRHQCSYCIVTTARGDERSRSIEAIVYDINRLFDQGYQEAVLTGVHLGGYGSDINTDLYCLVDTLLEKTSIPRIRLSSLEPWNLPQHMWKLWKSPRLMPHLHLPLQSGSNTVLKRMARRCHTDSFSSLVQSARSAIPNLTVTTDIIVGFPGETKDEWKETTDFISAMQFGHIHIFTYSPREHTRAASMPERVPKDIARLRSQELHCLADEHKKTHAGKSVGTMANVLWESSYIENETRIWMGYTENYIKTKTTHDHDLSGCVTPVLIDRTSDGVLWGEIPSQPKTKSATKVLPVVV